MPFLKLSLLLFASVFLNFHNCWAMNDEDDNDGLKNPVVRDLRGANINPNYQAGNFSITKIINNKKVYYTDFFMGLKRTEQYEKYEEKSPSFREIDVTITNDDRCKIINQNYNEKVLKRVLKGRDGRKRIVNTTDLPYRFHGHMIMTFANGETYTGSGTLVGPHHVLTAGHNIFSHEPDEGWATSVTFIPALNEDNKPYGKATGALLLSTDNWTANREDEYDFGMVILAQPIGLKTGWAGLFASNEENDLKKQTIHVSGYPGDKGNERKDSTELWTMGHKIKSIHKEKLYYDIDTYYGQSGSGVWTSLEGGYYVVGIHAKREVIEGEGNSATRLSIKKFNQVTKWIKEYQLANLIPNNICDIQLSKENFLISGVPYNKLNVSNGIMTLCFKKQNSMYSQGDPALVFEMFLPRTSPEVSLRMIHYGSNQVSCGMPVDPNVNIEGDRDTLYKVYRLVEEDGSEGIKKYSAPAYVRYASWIISNDKLLQALKTAENDHANNKLKKSSSSVKYVARIMETVGLKNVNFGYWRTIPNNLKLLVDEHINPKPNYTASMLPSYTFNIE